MAYEEAKPVRQIAFCDFTLFEGQPEFYSTYKLINVRNIDQIYTEKLVISNVDLTKLELATEEDRRYRLDEWGRFFKATTWKEMKMLAENNTSIEKAVSGVWQLTEDEIIREQCRAREEWLINDQWKTNKIEEQGRQIAQLTDQIARLEREVQELRKSQKKPDNME